MAITIGRIQRLVRTLSLCFCKQRRHLQ